MFGGFSTQRLAVFGDWRYGLGRVGGEEDRADKRKADWWERFKMSADVVCG